MPEESNLLGEDNENEAKIFFEKICKWEFLKSTFDIKETETARKKYGLDLIFRCFDPFMG